MRIGLDVGSTTLKCVVLDSDEKLVFHSYERHYSQIRGKTVKLLEEIKNRFPDLKEAYLSISGSAGMGLAQKFNIPFVQEVYATRLSVMKLIEGADAQQTHAVVHDADDEAADDRSRDRAGTAGEARAADDDGRDGIELEHHPQVRRSTVELRGEQDSGDGG